VSVQKHPLPGGRAPSEHKGWGEDNMPLFLNPLTLILSPVGERKMGVYGWTLVNH